MGWPAGQPGAVPRGDRLSHLPSLRTDFAIMYRWRMLDLVEEGRMGEVIEQAQIIEAAGADIITGIDWPRPAF